MNRTGPFFSPVNHSILWCSIVTYSPFICFMFSPLSRSACTVFPLSSFMFLCWYASLPIQVSEKAGGYTNRLVVTCIRSGLNRPFRVLQKPERAPIRALRASSSGRLTTNPWFFFFVLHVFWTIDLLMSQYLPDTQYYLFSVWLCHTQRDYCVSTWTYRVSTVFVILIMSSFLISEWLFLSLIDYLLHISHLKLKYILSNRSAITAVHF